MPATQTNWEEKFSVLLKMSKICFFFGLSGQVLKPGEKWLKGAVRTTDVPIRILICVTVMLLRILICTMARKIFTGLIKVLFFSFEINIFQKSFLECCLFWAPDGETNMSERTLTFLLDYFSFGSLESQSGIFIREHSDNLECFITLTQVFNLYY